MLVGRSHFAWLWVSWNSWVWKPHPAFAPTVIAELPHGVESLSFSRSYFMPVLLPGAGHVAISQKTKQVLLPENVHIR